MSSETENYRAILEELKNFPAARLLPVSKTFPAEAVRVLYDAGARSFGESRVAELEEKAKTLPSDIEWHFIGNLQANKVRRVLKTAKVIHSVDSAGLLERVDRIAGEEGVHPRVFLEVNISGEASKSGMTPEELEGAMRLRETLKNTEVSGLMTMAPQGAAEAELREIFGKLRSLADGYGLEGCSMGMSEDYHIALEMGSTLIRVGSKIFGKR